MRRWAAILGTTLFFVAVANFAAFWIIGVTIGGDAINGRAEDGRYYLANHGRYTEVSESVWTYSRIHAISVFVTHPVGILVGGGLMWWARRGARAGQQTRGA